MKQPSKEFQFNTYLLAPLSVISFLILLSFHKTPPKATNHEDKSAFPVIIDSLNEPVSFLTRTSISESDYDILYLGYEKDSIFLEHNSSPYRKNVQTLEVYDKYKGYDEAKIQIEIDLSQEIKDDASLTFEELVLSFRDTFATNIKYYKAYPVIIKNQEKKPIIIGHTGGGEQLSLILEAKDHTGKWRAIEEVPTYLCGFGIYPILLNPQEIIVTAVKIHQGTFKTELRLKFNHSNTYSRAFKGSIHPNQFTNPFDEETFFHGE